MTGRHRAGEKGLNDNLVNKRTEGGSSADLEGPRDVQLTPHGPEPTCDVWAPLTWFWDLPAGLPPRLWTLPLGPCVLRACVPSQLPLGRHGGVAGKRVGLIFSLLTTKK